MKDDSGYDSDDGCSIDSIEVEAKAYLTIPLLHAPIFYTPGLGTASFSVDSIIPLSRKKATERRLQLFRSATNVLKLHPYDPTQDETVGEKKPEASHDLDSDDDTDSEEPENGKDDSENAENDARESDVASLQDQGSARAPSNNITTEDENELGGQSREDQKVDDVARGASTNDAAGDTKVRAGSKEKATWPKLMLLGSGELGVDPGYLW